MSTGNKSYITRLGLLQRIRRWLKGGPDRTFRRHGPRTANFRLYGACRATWASPAANATLEAHGTLEAVARRVGLLANNELTVDTTAFDKENLDKSAKALDQDLDGAGAPKRGTKAFHRWLRRHPDFAKRVEDLKIFGLLIQIRDWREFVCGNRKETTTD